MRIVLFISILLLGCKSPTKENIDSLISQKSKALYKCYEDSSFQNDIKPDSSTRTFFCNNGGDFNMIQHVEVYPGMKTIDKTYFSKGHVVKIIIDMTFWKKWSEHLEYYIDQDVAFAKEESDPQYSMYEAIPKLISKSAIDYKKLDSIKKNY